MHGYDLIGFVGLALFAGALHTGYHEVRAREKPTLGAALIIAALICTTTAAVLQDIAT